MFRVRVKKKKGGLGVEEKVLKKKKKVEKVR